MKHTATLMGIAVVMSVVWSGVPQAAAREYPVPTTMPASRDLLDRAALVKAGASVTMINFANADDVVVDDYTMAEYASDGTAVQWSDTCVKLLSEKGKRDNTSISVGYDIVYETVMVDRVEIIKADGSVVPVDLATQSKHMVDSSQMGMNIYDPNSKVLTVGVPGLEIGDMRRVVMRRVSYKPRMPDTWCDFSVFEYLSPIKHSTYEVYGPADRPLACKELKAAVGKTVAFSTSTANGSNKYVWTVRNVPRMYDEPNMPALHTVVQRLLVSTIPDWETISKWYCNLSEPHLQKTTPGMSNTVEALVKNLATPQQKMEAIYYYVSQKIRYMGITTETTAPGYEPHDVDTTFNNKYGVCRDKAALLVTMLRIAGLKAYPVLIYVGPKKDIEVPQPYFNHAIVAVENSDGSYALMDPTDENTKELFPAYLCNRSYLVAKPEGDTLRTSLVTPAEENMLTVRTTGALAKDGTLTAETLMIFGGINDNAYRGMFARMKADERKQTLEGLVKRLAAGARLVDFNVRPVDMLDTSTGLVIRLAFEAKDVPVQGDKVAMIPALWAGTVMGVVNFIIGQTGLEERKYPFEIPYACGVRDTFRLDVGEAAGVPQSLPITAGQVTSNIVWRLELSQTGTFLEGACDFRINTVEIAPAEYKELKRILKDMEYDRRKRAVYAAKADAVAGADDIRVLDERTVCNIRDGQTATFTTTVRKKVLTYNGKKDEAEIKISYNPAWEEVKLAYARTTAKDGTVKEIAAQEKNLMDAAWAAAAPRYPAAKILVASLPNVDVDSVIEYQIVRTVKDRPFLSFEQYFRSFAPVDAQTFELEMPEGFAMIVTNAPGGSVPVVYSSSNGRERWSWCMTNQAPVKLEGSLPPWWYFNPGVLASAGSWPAYAAQVQAALQVATAKQPNTAARAKALVKDAPDDRARIIAIRDFIEKNIREAGPSFIELQLSALTPADKILADGYGNSADRAILYYAMLDAAGFKPMFVLGSFAPKSGSIASPAIACPQRSVFSDVLVRVPCGKETVYVNDTDQYAELGTTPHDGRPGLVLATGAIEPIRAAEGKEDRGEMQVRVTFDERGDATITSRRIIRGSEFATFHQGYAEMPPEERRRHFLEMVAGISQSAKAVGELVTKYDEYPGIEEFTVQAERYGVNDGKRFYFSLPAGSISLPGIKADTRQNPLYWDSDSRMTAQTIVELPASMQNLLLCPKDFTWQAPAGGGTIKLAAVRSTTGTNTLTVTREVDLQPAVIPSADYQNLLDTNRKLTHPGTRTVLFEIGK